MSGRERLLNAALKTFTVEGFEGASIRDIGRAAGLTNPALYRHFSSKDELGAELYRLCYKRILEAVKLAARAEKAPLDKVVAAVSAMYELMERDLAVFLYVDENQTRFWPIIRDEFAPNYLSRLMSKWIAAGRRDGSIDTSIPQPVQLAMAQGGLSEWAALRGANLVKRFEGRALGRAVRRALQK